MHPVWSHLHGHNVTRVTPHNFAVISQLNVELSVKTTHDLLRPNPVSLLEKDTFIWKPHQHVYASDVSDVAALTGPNLDL